jgi:small-conductance mechanosensitive channel
MAVPAWWRACGLALLVVVALAAGGLRAGAAQEAAPALSQEQLEALRALLDNPAVRALATEGQPAPSPAAETVAEEAESLIAVPLARLRDNLAILVTSVPRVPAELARAWTILLLDLEGRSLLGVLLLIGVFIGLGLGCERLFWHLSRAWRQRIAAAVLETPGDRLRTILQRLIYGVAWVGALAAGTFGAFVLLGWPPLLNEIVGSYLIVFLVTRLAQVIGRVLLSPTNDRLRIIPVADDVAAFWHRMLAWLVGWFAFGWVTVNLLATLGVGLGVRRLVAYTLGLGLLAMGMWIAFARPRTRLPQPAAPEAEAPAAAEPPTGPPPEAPLAAVAASPVARAAISGKDWALAGFFLLVWALWVVRVMPLFWLAVVAFLVPVLMRLTHLAVTHVLRPVRPGVEQEPPGPWAVCIERGIRALWIAVGILILTWAWGIGLEALTAAETPATRLARAALNIVLIVLLADLGWHLLRTMIDRKLAGARLDGTETSEEARRRARLRTLLPIFRNLAWIVILVIAVLMALASLGVEIGPLIAGAGVVGVAVGFGSQTLVKDIISGMFYLLDDAFRVGEYIQSGSYKGTVESFSLRSVKLRHHRGPLYTVPFGELGAVQNMSRDWVIDKMTLGVTYDTDIDKVKKVIKKISAELAADPELAPNFIEPLKMQGVDQFGDFAIQIRMKMKTKPGEQFTIRRRAYAMIKKAFRENGINFAFPTVTVAGGEGDAQVPAVAKEALDLVRKPAAAE